MRVLPVNQQTGKVINRARILRLIKANEPISRAELARRTGLNKATVSALVRELIAEQMVQEMGVQAGDGLGRPSILLRLNPQGGFIVGAELRVGRMRVISADLQTNVLARWELQTRVEEPSGVVVSQLIDLVQVALAHGRRRGLRPLGVGVALPGLLRLPQGEIISAVNFGWRDVPILEPLRQRCKLPVFAQNIARAGALAEHYLGAARGIDDFIYVHVDDELGGGLFCRGELYSGAAGHAGEIGHMTLLPEGPPCHCGNRGCWEVLANQQAVLERYAAARAPGEEGAAGEAELPVNLTQVIVRARLGDPQAEAALRETGAYLGLGIANLVNALNPRLVILGGALSLANQFVLNPLEEVLARRALKCGAGESVAVRLSPLGADSALLGAVSLVLNEVLGSALVAEGIA